MSETLVKKYFPEELKKKIDLLCKKYEDKRAPLLEVLHEVMNHHGHLSLEAETAVAEYMSLPPVAVREVVSFYTLYYTKPRAKLRFNVCRTLSCALGGSNEIVKHLEEKTGLKPGEQSKDGAIGIQAVECLGACEEGPMMQVNDDHYVGRLTREKIDNILEEHGCSCKKK